IQVFRSDTNGASFTAPVNGTPGGSSEDKEWLTVDNFAGAGQGNVYLISRNFGGGAGIYLYRSTNHGDSFGPTGGTLIAGEGSFNVQGAFVTVGSDHSVYVFWLDQSAGSATSNIVKMRKSTDQGVTFGPEVALATLNTTGVNGDLGLTGTINGTSSRSY